MPWVLGASNSGARSLRRGMAVAILAIGLLQWLVG
jgi:hypothetical protein